MFGRNIALHSIVFSLLSKHKLSTKILIIQCNVDVIHFQSLCIFLSPKRSGGGSNIDFLDEII